MALLPQALNLNPAPETLLVTGAAERVRGGRRLPIAPRHRRSNFEFRNARKRVPHDGRAAGSRKAAGVALRIRVVLLLLQLQGG